MADEPTRSNQLRELKEGMAAQQCEQRGKAVAHNVATSDPFGVKPLLPQGINNSINTFIQKVSVPLDEATIGKVVEGACKIKASMSSEGGGNKPPKTTGAKAPTM